MKIRLIDPAPKDNMLMQTAKDIKSYWFARLSLTTIAALTPPGIEVAITDENVEPIDFDEDVDLVVRNQSSEIRDQNGEIDREKLIDLAYKSFCSNLEKILPKAW